MTDTPKIPTVKDAIIAVASAQFSDLLRESFSEVTKDALKHAVPSWIGGAK